MSKKLKEIEVESKNIKMQQVKLEKEIKMLNKQLDALDAYRFHCKKCGLAFKPNEVCYKDWEVRRTKQEFQPMGEYDIWQVVELQHLACCPKCGHDFGAKVSYSDYISSTPRYSRWEEKPEMAKCYKKCIDKTMHNVSKSMVEYMNEKHYSYD